MQASGPASVGPPPPRAVAQPAGVDQHRHHQDQRVHALYRPVRIVQPGVDQRRERQEYESERRQKDAMIGALEIGG
jgi:hypothetical protein